MTISDLDLCTYCGGYDTIQSYIPLDEEHTIFIHVCEKCASGDLNELVKSYIKQHPTVLNKKWVG